MTSERMQELVTELNGMKISLDEDPTVVGLDSFNEKLSKLDAYNERLADIFQEALQTKCEMELERLSAEVEYEQSYNESLATSKEIQALRSNDIRKAILDTKLKPYVERKHLATITALKAENFFKRIEKRYKDLEAKSERLYKQMDVVRQLIHLDPILRDSLTTLNTEKRVLTIKQKD